MNARAEALCRGTFAPIRRSQMVQLDRERIGSAKFEEFISLVHQN